jgi:hypothetical protein
MSGKGENVKIEFSVHCIQFTVQSFQLREYPVPDTNNSRPLKL